LRFVPQADLANFDPIWNTQYVVRNGAALIWDMLYAWTTSCSRAAKWSRLKTYRRTASPGHSGCGRTEFHDGEPVLAKDVVASLSRWQARDNNGAMLKAIENELAASMTALPLDAEEAVPGKCWWRSARSARFLLHHARRDAATDPFKPINEYVGSGPMKLSATNGFRAPSRLFEKFSYYVPARAGSWVQRQANAP